jgi:hypothetical protein
MGKKCAYLSKDPAFCSHKSNGCAFQYKIAVSFYQSKIMGIYGPYPYFVHTCACIGTLSTIEANFNDPVLQQL